MNLGVVVGRFQVPELHEGHRKLVEYVKAQHHQVLVCLGVSQVLGSKRNPLDYLAREKMIREAFPDVVVAPLADMPTDEAWSQQLDSIAKILCPVGTVTLYGGRDSFIPYYKGGNKTVDVEIGYAPSGTDVRRVSASRVLVSSDFRAGMIYACANQYGRVFPTVDIAILSDQKVLLAKKPNQDFWCFPGGFVDTSDLTLEQAAWREAFEETGVRLGPLRYVGSFRIEDWRYRSQEDGQIMTTFFCAEAENAASAKANDDVDRVDWFSLEGAKEVISPSHRPLALRLPLARPS